MVNDGELSRRKKIEEKDRFSGRETEGTFRGDAYSVTLRSMNG